MEKKTRKNAHALDVGPHITSMGAARSALARLDDDALVLCLQRIFLTDVSNVRRSCRRGHAIDLGSFLPRVLENSIRIGARQHVLSEKFCQLYVHPCTHGGPRCLACCRSLHSRGWPCYVLPMLLRVPGVHPSKRDYGGRTALHIASKNGRADIVVPSIVPPYPRAVPATARTVLPYQHWNRHHPQRRRRRRRQ